MTATESEQEDNHRLRKAVEFLAYCRAREARCRRELAAAVEETKYASGKHRMLFDECEKRAVVRRKSGLTETRTD